MTLKRKNQASSQRGQKSSSGATTQPAGRIKFKQKHKEESAKAASANSLIPFTKYGIGYASLVLIIGMY